MELAAAGDSAGWGLWLIGLLWVAAFIYVMARAASGKSFDTVHAFLGWLAYWAFFLLAGFWQILMGYSIVTSSSGYVLVKLIASFSGTYVWWLTGWMFLRISKPENIPKTSQLMRELWMAMKNPLNPPC